jgi:hypothetical protein
MSSDYPCDILDNTLTSVNNSRTYNSYSSEVILTYLTDRKRTRLSQYIRHIHLIAATTIMLILIEITKKVITVPVHLFVLSGKK